MTHVVYVPVGGARTDERLLVVFDTSTPVGGPLRLVDVADDALVRSCSSLCAGCTPTIRPTTPGRYRRAHRRGVRPLILVEHVVGCPAAAQAVRVVAGRVRAATSVSWPQVTRTAS